MKKKTLPCILLYTSRINVKVNFREYIPVTFGLLSDPDRPTLESYTPWDFDRPESSDQETDTYELRGSLMIISNINGFY